MPEFLKLVSPEDALALWFRAMPPRPALPAERIRAQEAIGRVTATDISTSEALPPFTRASVDGYAVRAEDTFGASTSLPGYLSLVGEVMMGSEPAFTVGGGQAALIHTGGMLPAGSNAVVMLEDTQTAPAHEVEILRAVSPGANVIQAGEDLMPGDLALPRGRRLRPQDIGGLMAAGILELDVVRKPRVALISTGDELVAPGLPLPHGKIRDVNSAMLTEFVRSAGGTPSPQGILSDSPGALPDALRRVLMDHDLVIVAAGSSVSTRDVTAESFAGLGEPGVVVHGVAIRPGKPTILAVAHGIPLVGLPGNPVSALIVAHVLVMPMLRGLQGLPPIVPLPSLRARLIGNIPSEAGRTDFQPVRLEERNAELLAEPVFGKSNLIFTLARAGGVVRIPPQVTGIEAGTMVEVIPFESWIGGSSAA